MSAIRTKTFSISDPEDLERIDSWWATLLRKGAKEILGTEWVANGDLTWILKVSWGPVNATELAFNVCMPAYSRFTVEDLTEILMVVQAERSSLSKNLKLIRLKVEDWELIEIDPSQAMESFEDQEQEDHDIEDSMLSNFDIDPSLSYGAKLDVVDKIMASEFLWPSYKGMKRALLMCDARIAEVKKEIEYRADPAYTVVHVDRGMLRASFVSQLGYDNRWLFATEEEILEDHDHDGETETDDR